MCKSDSGAVLFFQPPAVTTHVQAKRRIVTYMRKHFPNWLALANNRLELDLKEQDLFFVSGTTTTSKWSLSAFQDSALREKEGHVYCDLGDIANAKLSFSMSESVYHSPENNHGPVRRPEASAELRIEAPAHGGGPSGNTQFTPSKWPHHDQTIFIHYYKMKTRLLWKRVIRAAAGAHQLPGKGDDEDEGAVGVRAEGDGDSSSDPESTHNPHVVSFRGDIPLTSLGR